VQPAAPAVEGTDVVPPVGAYVVVALVAAAGTYVAMFPLRRLAMRIGFVAEPDERRIHTRITPYGGGVAMFVAFLVAMIVASQLLPLQAVFQGSSEPLGVVLGAAVIFAVGLADDIKDVSAPAKMAGEVLAAMVLVFLGVTMVQFKIPLVGFLILSPGSQWLPLLTALWVIVITNAVNLIDGLDGLAAGIVAIASGALAVYGLRLVDLGQLPPDNLGPLIAVITCGVCVGFLPHNFHPARAFMGDAGALFLGLLMAAATMEIGGRQPEGSGQTFFFFAPLFIPVFILGVPIADMAFAFVRRTAKGTGFHTPDLDHVHYRLLRLGHGPRRTVVILWAWTALLSGFVLYPLFASKANAFIPFGAVVLGLVLYTLFHPGLRKNIPPVDGAAADPTVLVPAPGGGVGAPTDGSTTASSATVVSPGFDPEDHRGSTPRERNGAYGLPVVAPVVVPESVADSK
jgi:UDP-GlcNAc:undecaprenyl-phosphate/decaprenyl-phosphate GlcNAc-1-phosphate transferase